MFLYMLKCIFNVLNDILMSNECDFNEEYYQVKTGSISKCVTSHVDCLNV